MITTNHSETKVAGIHDIALIMRDEFGVLVKDSEQNIRQVLKAIGIALKDNDAVHIKGYLKINKKLTPKRMGRNPKTGEPVEIAEHTSLTYKTGNVIKDYIK